MRENTIEDAEYDVAVIGLGAVGAMALWRAAADGVRAIGIERFTPGHSRGSSHGGSRIFRRTLFEGQHYVPLATRSLQLWRELEARSGQTLLQPSGGLVIGPRGGELIQTALESAQNGGVEHELLEADVLQARYPQHAHIPGDVAVFEPAAGVLNPERCIASALGLARDLGAAQATNVRVISLRHDSDRVRIETDDHRTITARRAIVATGAWFTDLAAQCEIPIQIVRSPLVWFTGADRDAYRPGRFPTFVRASADLDCWGIPDVDGRGVKVGAGPSAPKPVLSRADENTYPIDERDTGPAEESCARALPALHPRASHAIACMNARTPDRDFVLGISERAPALVLAGGMSGHGFKHAPGSAQLCVELAIEGGSSLADARFSPDRFADGTPRRG